MIARSTAKRNLPLLSRLIPTIAMAGDFFAAILDRSIEPSEKMTLRVSPFRPFR
jgi:hypothetical protein